jgi:hypothetical protein
MAEEGRNAPVSLEERVTALERKMKESDALVKGLTDELLDLKSVAMRLARISERPERVISSRPAGQDGTGPLAAPTVVIPKKPAPAAAAAAREAEPDRMDMIMQPDGTMKLEKRRGDEHYIVASAGNAARIRAKQGEPADPKKRSELIVAEEDEKAASRKS